MEQKASAKISKEIGIGLEDRLEMAALALESQKPTTRVANKDKVQHVRDHYVQFTAEIPLDGDPLHDLRKATKRLRYRLEAIPGRESRAFESDLKTVQESIGVRHDWATQTAEEEKRLEP